MTNTGYIILRDVPKQEAQIDLSMYEIKGGFRGFQRLPAGPHYVSVKLGDGTREGVWCYVPPGGVVVKVLGYPDPYFNDDDPQTAAHFSDLAKSGAMHAVLIRYDPDNLKTWETLTDHVGPDDFPPAFRALQEDGPGPRWQRRCVAGRTSIRVCSLAGQTR